MTGAAANDHGGQPIRAVIGLILTLGLVLGRVNQAGERFAHMTPLQSRDLFWWALLAAILLYILVVERRPLSSIGIHRPGWTTLVFGVLGAAAVFAVEPVLALALVYFHLDPQAGAGQAKALMALPYWYKLTLVTRAAVVEEIVFRGYAIERLSELTGSRTAAVIIATALFVYGHLAFWGWVPLIGVTLAGLILALLYVWRRDLIANMIAHFIIDGAALLL